MEEAVQELRDQFGGLPRPGEAADIWSDIWHQEAHNSTAIEGNTLILREVEKLLDEGQAIGAKPLRDYLEVQGYAEAAKWVYGQALESGDWQDGSLVSMQEIRHIHYLAMTPVWTVAPHPHAIDAEAPGNFRQHEIASFPGGMKPPPWPEVDSLLLRSWVDTTDTLRTESDMPLAERLGVFHHRFEVIHPFLDGNGRVGRLILSLLLGRLGCPPAIIYKRDRSRYLTALQRADQGDPGALGELIARSVTGNIYRFLMPATADAAHLVPLPALASSELSEAALRVAASRGRLRAVKGDDGAWRSSRSWVEEYARTRWRRERA
ncbi:Fic family protein [Micromonospora sp. NPDC051196]|uniref:Fic family protein n=1 Tax=Micromonospora sp. NPDC051196 TaxID=3155281 RepID=UPI00343D32ED